MSLNETVSAERLHIGFFGMRNAGKSSVVNAVTGQDLAVVSDVKGTTTDPVKKAMELLPLGPVVIIDTPGSKNYLFEAAHNYADTLITPITDSLIDLFGIADIDSSSGELQSPGPYAEFVWDVKKRLASKGKPYLNWIICGNKTSTTRSRNKTYVFEVLEKLGKLYGFRFCNGLKDRVIYRELFLDGLTVLDMQAEPLKRRMSMSHLAAKLEIKNLAEFICP